jgi:hypothetical protein
MWCFGPQQNGPTVQFNINRVVPKISGSGFLSNNVDAASLSEDITTNGERGSGQSETSIAASGPYVLEGWNDSTGFFAPCPSPGNKEELSGFGFSSKRVRVLQQRREDVRRSWRPAQLTVQHVSV